jgi:hypothetical protein
MRMRRFQLWRDDDETRVVWIDGDEITRAVGP